MTSFLLAISFILHFIFVFIIVLMWRKLQNFQLNNQDHIKSEIEDLLVAYMTEMKDENENFLKSFQKMNQKTEATKSTQNEEIHKQNVMVDNTEKRTQMSIQEEITFAPPYDKIEDKLETSLTQRAIELSKQGNNIEQIAKKLNKGKGEVELLLKFYKD